METEGFDAGDRVMYIPQHASSFKDVEHGVVTSKNDWYVFVNFGNGDTSAACRPEDLEILKKDKPR